MDLKELGLIDPRTHWYYQTKLFALRDAITRFASKHQKITDVGSGSGFLATELMGGTADGEVLCIDPNYPRDWSNESGSVRYVRRASDADLLGTDVFLFVDVLEHVDDDLGLLNEYLKNAQSGALVLITVPAFQSMWSAHDVYLEHLRRYRMSGIRSVAERAGLSVVHCQYLYASIFPIAWAVRWFRRSRRAASDLQPVPRPLNTALTLTLNAEHRLRRNRLFGLSVLVVAKVP